MLTDDLWRAPPAGGRRDCSAPIPAALDYSAVPAVARLAVPRSRRVLPARLLVVLAATLLPACSTVSYLAQAAHGQWQLMHARRPIPRVIDDPATQPQLKARLTLVEDAREFAVTDLGLPDNRSYRSYSDLKRPYALWNVVAAPRFSVEPVRWCFPIAGCVDYRGYFHERRARQFAAKLESRGDDVMVEGVTAYSTLGHFADPVLSTMMRYDDMELVSTIFHELAHQLIYVPGDSVFDESFAVTVQTEGLERWLRARGRSQEMRQYSQDQRLEQQIDATLAAGRAQLKTLYASPLPQAQMGVQKAAILAHTGEQVLALEHRSGMRTEYDDWIATGLNNAHLAAVGTYYDCVPGFEGLLKQEQGSLPRFYAAVRRIARDRSARRALCGDTDEAEEAAAGAAAQPTGE
jgi:predicted aminopeptidase